MDRLDQISVSALSQAIQAVLQLSARRDQDEPHPENAAQVGHDRQSALSRQPNVHHRNVARCQREGSIERGRRRKTVRLKAQLAQREDHLVPEIVVVLNNVDT